jgi:hypothetical protein
MSGAPAAPGAWTCPGCGAPYAPDAHGRCRYCGAQLATPPPQGSWWWDGSNWTPCTSGEAALMRIVASGTHSDLEQYLPSGYALIQLGGPGGGTWSVLAGRHGPCLLRGQARQETAPVTLLADATVFDGLAEGARDWSEEVYRTRRVRLWGDLRDCSMLYVWLKNHFVPDGRG